MNDPGTTRATRVGLLNFEPLRITGLREILVAQGEFEVSTVRLPGLLKAPPLDILILALRDTELTCSLISMLRSSQPRLRIAVMGSAAGEDTIVALIAAGAKGWIEEKAAPQEIAQALRIVHSGSIWAPRHALSMLVDRALGGKLTPQSGRRAHFTGREQDILNQLVLARSNREIAQALSLREQTVKSYIARMMRKVGVDNRIALSMQAAEMKRRTEES